MFITGDGELLTLPPNPREAAQSGQKRDREKSRSLSSPSDAHVMISNGTLGAREITFQILGPSLMSCVTLGFYLCILVHRI